ncbi:hypothetical protein AR457_00215 [Streptomyces agglomeratus]|uniref:LmeA family phospholipid-binding protein n=1 Tax=Streptomyces agglomeratus TaxID=285458 RepID=UPI0008544554|nr:DUF2993 domain-containing protein [Streptomyces agglomeratus]OEJ42781.1 hypothetical protein AR457_00215 [Streptomyces agglomeratus]OEJ55300.1 hypothetical protein BGK72_35615 [Streptomyces agglomeratus]OEJ62649.1 hypothetical protein BGM19_36435 [Streptomyces agglomeratus]
MKQRLAKTRAAVRRHLVLTVTTAVLLLAVAATGAAEFTARTVIQNRIAKAAPALGSSLAVSVAGDWALWDLAHEGIPRLDISSSDARLGPLPQVRVRARLDDVRLGERATVGSASAPVTASTQSIAAAIRTAAPSVQVAAVTTDPAKGTIVAAVGPGGAGQLTLRPVLADGRGTLAVDGLTVFGRSVPTGRLGMGDGGLGPEPGARKEYPLGLKATSVHVQPDGLYIALTGGPGTLNGA